MYTIHTDTHTHILTRNHMFPRGVHVIVSAHGLYVYTYVFVHFWYSQE